MAYATGAALLQYAADTTMVPLASLPATWTRQSTAAVNLAYANILSFVAEIGYSAGQLVAFDQAEDWNLSQGLYELAGLAGGFAQYERAWFDRFNLVKLWTDKELKCIPLLAGKPIAPDGTSDVGGLKYGTVTATTNAGNLFDRF